MPLVAEPEPFSLASLHTCIIQDVLLTHARLSKIISVGKENITLFSYPPALVLVRRHLSNSQHGRQGGLRR